MRVIIGRTLAVFVLGCYAQKLVAQTPFDPFPNGLADRYRFDLPRLFYASPEVAATERRILYERLVAFTRATPTATRSANALLQALSRSDSLLGAVWRQSAYLSLTLAVNTGDAASQRASDSLDTKANEALTLLSGQILDLDEEVLARYRREQPALSAFAFRIVGVRRRRGHVLAPPQERQLRELTPFVSGWQSGLFSTTISSATYDVVHTPAGDRDVRRNGSEIASSSDRRVREAGFLAGRKAQESRRDIFAFGLINTVTGRNALSQARHYADFPEQSYADRFLTTTDVRATLATLATISESNRRYERAQIAATQRIAGYDTVHTWDLTMPDLGTSAPRFTIAEASRTILAATAPLGETYSRQMTSLLDPINGRLDLIPRPGRADRQGFSTGSVGYPSTFFQGRFEGYLPDLIVLAHEGAHAVQNMLMTDAGVRPQYAQGPAYFTESFAGFNELLVTDYLYTHATETSTRRYYLQRFLDQATEVFKSARESAFEQAMYDSVAAGRLNTADDFESLMQNIGSRYSIWFGKDSLGRGERTMQWVNALHFFTRPMYRINSVYAKLLALAYFERYTRDRSRFVSAYARLLANGYDAPPDALLEHVLGIRLNDPELARAAARVIDERVSELKRLSEVP